MLEMVNGAPPCTNMKKFRGQGRTCRAKKKKLRENSPPTSSWRKGGTETGTHTGGLGSVWEGSKMGGRGHTY